MKPTALLGMLTATVLGVTMTGFTQELDRTIRPKGQGTLRIDLPDIQKTTLKNGLKVWLVEQHELPLVAFNLVLQSGTDHDPANLPGLASLTADMLDEGTRSRTALQIAEELDFLGASLDISTFTDGTTLRLNTLSKHLDRALDVYADVIVNPTFPQQEFDRLRQLRLTALLQQKDRPGVIASLVFNKILYGEHHPYGQNSTGTERSLNAMTRDDLVKFFTTYYRPNNATLLIVGDVKLKQIAAKLEKLLAAWKSSSIPALNFPPTPLAGERRIYLVDKPAAAQSEVRIGMPAAARNTPDFFALTVMNNVLGGQFSSRLNMNLREKHGYTYGARSAFSFTKQPGPFVASAAVVTAKTDSSVKEFFYEIEKMRNEGMTAEELEFTKKSLTGTFARNFETPAQIAGALQNLVLYNLPDDYYDTYLQSINAVTLDDVKRVSSRYLDTKKMTVVIVGDRKAIKEGLEKLNIGEVILADADGNRITQ